MLDKMADAFTEIGRFQTFQHFRIAQQARLGERLGQARPDLLLDDPKRTRRRLLGESSRLVPHRLVKAFRREQAREA